MASPLADNAAFQADLRGPMSSNKIAAKHDTARSTVQRWRLRLGISNDGEGDFETTESSDGTKSTTTVRTRPITLDDARKWIEGTGDNPDDYTLSIRSIAYGEGLHSNKMSAVPKHAAATGAPLWPVIQPGPSLVIKPLTFTPRNRKWKTAVLMADTQIGYRRFEDDTLDPFHDEAAISVALQIVQIENPDRTVVMGDIIDMAEQGRFAQEAAFANTTQPALDRTTEFGGQLRAGTNGFIDFIEGNHDLRLQNFVEANAKAAFGLRKGGMPESWPVMSLPNLLRLDESGITYHDAYPAAHVWINNQLRCEHGTKVNSSGSTVAKYAAETPHISTASGHTHRQEAQGRTTFDRMGKIVSTHINPGCLCRVDGGVPSVKGAIGANGRPAEVFENWQQGVAVVRYLDDDFRVELVQIQDGMTFYDGQEIAA